MEFYDIKMRVPAAVNPWKARLALNFKDCAHKTVWVPLKDIPTVRRGLDVPACRKLATGDDYYTLPVLVDPSTGAKVGDSFDIAIYLQRTYPSGGAGDLFPADLKQLDFTWDEELPPWAPPLSERNTEDEYSELTRFNSHVDAAFSVHSGLMGWFMELDSAESKEVIVQRAHLSSWDDLKMEGEVRAKMLESLKGAMGKLAVVFAQNEGGPFAMGERACYADLIVGGWLHMMQATMPKEEFQAAREWHGGVFGRLYDGLEKYATIH